MNRSKSAKKNQGLQFFFKFLVFVILGLIFATLVYIFGKNTNKVDLLAVNEPLQQTLKYDYLPTATGEVIHHTYYSLSYKETYEQPEWVAYILTKASIQMPNVKRERDFFPDPKVSSYSATSNDYKGSGYTRGHMVPAGDMAFDVTAMRETFYMSNISPQLRQLNGGIWRELEENVRDWAYHADSLYVISGPILTKPIKKIGNKNKVAVPSAFYKVLLDNKGPEKKAIGFIIPHELSEKRLESYMVSVSDIEAATGMKFFANMSNQQEISRLKSTLETTPWKVNEKRYQLRINKWNYQ